MDYILQSYEMFLWIKTTAAGLLIFLVNFQKYYRKIFKNCILEFGT